MNLKSLVGYTLLLLPIVGLYGYGAFVEPSQLEVTQHKVGDASSRSSVRIVLISDLHLQDMDDIRRAVARRTVEAKPDVVVLSGDIVDSKDSLPALEIFLNDFGPVQKIAVLGNWEYWSEVDLKALAKLYAKHQAKLLVNDCDVVLAGGRALAFVGLDDALSGKPNLSKAQNRCGDVDTDGKILIEHSPGFFGKPLPAPVVNPPYLLSLSGHTHGGQVAVFGRPIETPPGSGEYNRGWYDTRFGKLYVSRGIGTTEIPMRIGSIPELSVFELKLQ